MAKKKRKLAGKSTDNAVDLTGETDEEDEKDHGQVEVKEEVELKVERY